MKKVAVIMGSDSDLPIVEKCINELKRKKEIRSADGSSRIFRAQDARRGDRFCEKRGEERLRRGHIGGGESGALTIACAKRNPQGKMTGLDRWGKEYASFNNLLCVQNVKAEGINNIDFQKGDANKLPFADESFDAVVSNYVYHNIPGKNKQELLFETLRVLKKVGPLLFMI